MEAQSSLSELTIMPDGRIYVFGASAGILEVLQAVSPSDPDLARLAAHVRGLQKGAQKNAGKCCDGS